MIWLGLFSDESAATAAQAVAQAATSQGIPMLAKEEVPGGPLLIAAYLVMWIVVFAYLIWMHRTNQRLLAEVELLEQRLDERIAEGNEQRKNIGPRGT
ncbi:MAG: CcmD family protein [Myxococcales bacterium]|nr:CcmD family protein [Myxococcales bacterium]